MVSYYERPKEDIIIPGSGRDGEGGPLGGEEGWKREQEMAVSFIGRGFGSGR